MGLKIIFFGTPLFALPALESLLRSEHEVLAVLTQPDRPSGRGRKLTASPIKECALKNNISVLQPQTLRAVDIQETLKNFNADVMVVVAYGLIFPKEILSIPKIGCFNIHPSLLPRWRGAAPIQRSLLAGDAETGVTIMQMDIGMDSGNIWLQKKYEVKSTDNSGKLHDLFSHWGAELLLETLSGVENKTLISRAQLHDQATYAEKISKSETKINWQQSAQFIDRQIRAFSPHPGVHTFFKNSILKIHEVLPLEQKCLYTPGTITHLNPQNLVIACGSGQLQILKIQLAGGKPIPIQDFINAHREDLKIGIQFPFHA